MTGLARIEDNYDVDLTSTAPQAKKLRTEFIEFVERIAPKDEYGNVKEYPDFESSFELFRGWGGTSASYRTPKRVGQCR